MLGQRALIKKVKLYKDKFPVAVMTDNEEDILVGWVLTHPDPAVFKDKLEHYDVIEDYYPDRPEDSYYLRKSM